MTEGSGTFSHVGPLAWMVLALSSLCAATASFSQTSSAPVAATAPSAATPSAAPRTGSAQERSAALVAALKAPGWNVARTTWGDPDLQGTFTNKYEQSTPLERPKGFDGRRVEDVQGDELRRVLEERQRISDERAPFLAGDPTGEIRGNPAFSDRGEIVKGSRAWMLIDPSDGRIPPLTADAQARIAGRAAARGSRRASSFSNGPFDTFDDFSLYDRCITRGLPGSMLPAIYGDSYQILQAPGLVAIRYEMIHETRLIAIDAAPHVSSRVRLDMGDARGHWEGETLVVETTNFAERSIYRNADPAGLRLVERFTRTSPTSVEWTVTVDDPKTWTRPWTFSLPLTLNESEPVIEYACHEGNYAMPHMLSASRAAERAAAGR